MDIDRAKEMILVLADGINPLTGEILPSSDSCNQPEIIRALHTVLRHLDKNISQKKTGQPLNAGKPWATEEDELLCQMYDAGHSTKELCSHFNRSRGAIIARLERLRKR